MQCLFSTIPLPRETASTTATTTRLRYNRACPSPTFGLLHGLEFETPPGEKG